MRNYKQITRGKRVRLRPFARFDTPALTGWLVFLLSIRDDDGSWPVPGFDGDFVLRLQFSVCAFAVLDNHLQIVLRLNDQVAAGWSDDETVRRRGKLFRPRGKDRQALKVTEAWVEVRLKDAKWIAESRKRLHDPG